MQPHYTLTDTAFEAAFADCTLPVEWFTHEAHLRLAWLHIKQYGLVKATENICNQLIQFTAFVGAQHKYNATYCCCY